MHTVAHRRQYPRYAAVFSTKYTLTEGTFRDLIQNIGAGGVYIKSRRPIRLGRRINVQIPVFAFGRRLSIMGSVVRCNPEGFAVMFKEDIDVKLFKDGRFPANTGTGGRVMIKIDKHCPD
jgi:Tfp pilus assembly protein PilZ